MDEVDLFVEVAIRTGMEAMRLGLARKEMSQDELYKTVTLRIQEARQKISLIMEKFK